MDNSNASGSNKFGFGKPATSTNEKADSTTSPVEEYATNVPDKSDEESYTDKSSVTISLIINHSLFRKKNDKVLPKKNDFIGSSFNSTRILSSNEEEVKKYFPNIVGLSPTHDDFVDRVKQWLSNIKIIVNELGVTLDTSFIYDKKSDYYKFKAKVDAIEEAYLAADRKTYAGLKEALKVKITDLNALESTKHNYGRPVNVEDYLVYRHCLLYDSVAKDPSVVNTSTKVRFYFKDDQKEAEKAKKFRLEINKAKTNYVALLADSDLFKAVYIQYLVQSNLPVISSLAEDVIIQETKLDAFSAQEPIKFNKMFNNKHVRLIGNIELLIARGELSRSPYNQNITTSDGAFVGANMIEAIAWFNNPDNKSLVDSYYNRLKNI